MASRLRSLWRNILHRDRVERDLDDEVRAAFEMLVEEQIAAGVSPADAHRIATLRLGRIESIKTHVRDVRIGALWDACLQDARYGARMLWRNPLFTLTATLSLAICIGANTTVFTIANRLLFREAAGVADADRLVDIAPVRRDGGFAEPVLPYRLYTNLREHVTTLEDLYGYQLDLPAMSLRASGAAERVFSTQVTTNYFTALGIRPAIGRLFAPEESDRPELASAVVLSYGFWKRRFNGDPAVIGQTFRLNDQPRTVIGVTPDGFHGLSVVMADVWLPLSAPDEKGVRLAVGGRLKPGVSVRQAAAEVDTLGRALHHDLPQPPQALGSLREDATTDSLRAVPASAVPAVVRVALYAFLGILMVLVSLVLVIACANLAGVLLARATTRRREIAVRLAMGAGRSRLVRQLLIETMLLFALGGAAGLALARIMTSLIVLALPALPVPIDTSLPLDGRVLAFTAIVSLIAAVVSGLVPSLQASKADVVGALKAESQSTSDRLRLRSAFVIAQVAFSIVLVVGAGLLVRAMQRAVSVDLGFDAKGIEVTALDLSLGGYANATGPQAIDELLEDLRTNSAVSGAAVATSLPLGGQRRLCCGIEVPGVAPPAGEQYFQPFWNVISPGYFNTLKIRLLAGRDFTTADRAGTEQVAIVSEAAARRYWPGESALGKHVIWQQIPSLVAREPNGPMRAPALRPVQLVIVGVAANLNAGTSRAAIYIPFSQHYDADISLIARSTNGQRLTHEVLAAVTALNPNLPVIAASRLADQASPVLLQLRVSAAVSAGVGLIALLLAAIGIYGLTAYTVTRRTREIGVRLALGAERADVVRMVLRQGMSLVLTGSAIGLVIAAASSRALVRILFGVPPLDPLTFGAAAVLFAGIGLAACYVPARRAVRISAIEALRYE